MLVAKRYLALSIDVTSMADLERCYDEEASRLRFAFVAEVAALYQSEAA